MNNHLIKIFAAITSCSLFIAGCSGGTDSFETPGSSANVKNSGTVSQKNLSILAADVQPEVYDPDTKIPTDTTVVITVKIGDRSNVLLTDAHTVFFRTEWGLIDNSCETSDGICTVNWQTSFGPGTEPGDHLVTIVAYTLGEEGFNDTNSNGEFDAQETYSDREEPFIDVIKAVGVPFDSNNDIIIDVMSGNELGANGIHDFGDGFYNGTNCTHSSECSTIRETIFIWADIELDMDGPPPAAVP